MRMENLGGSVMDTTMENVQKMKRETGLRDECEKIRQRLRRTEKDLFIKETRLGNEIKEKKQSREHNAVVEKDLMKTVHELEETKTALKVLMEQRKRERIEFEERIVYNLKEITLPYIDRLRKRVIDSDCRIYLDIIETNITKVMRPLIHTKIPPRADLTPSEIKVATLIGEGKSTKEISILLNISESGTEYHRNNIREKLGIKNQNVNLRKFINSLLTTEVNNKDASIFFNMTHQPECVLGMAGEKRR